jgi:hypothetical protein
MLGCVCACDPLTGEVIEIAMAGRFWYAPRWIRGLRHGLGSWLWLHFGISLNDEIPKIHRFAPAPLQLCEIGHEYTLKGRSGQGA